MQKLIPKSNINPAIIGELNKYSYYARDVLSKNTNVAYYNACKVFEKWCRENDLSCLPASFDTIVRFIDEMAECRSVATVKLYIAGIKRMHMGIEKTLTKNGLSNPCDSQEVKMALKRMSRKKGVRQKQAPPINFALRSRLIGCNDGVRLVDFRNRALIAVMYDTSCRRSEIMGIKIEDIEYTESGISTILIRKSKTDQEGKGRTQIILSDTTDLVKEWLSQSKIESGFLFQSIRNSRATGRPLLLSSISKNIKRICVDAGIPAIYSCHSTRVGGAQDCVSNGLELSQIMTYFGWKTPAMVTRYAERLNPDKSCMALLGKMQNRA